MAESAQQINRDDLENMERQLIPLLNNIRAQLGKPPIIVPRPGESWRKVQMPLYGRNEPA